MNGIFKTISAGFTPPLTNPVKKAIILAAGMGSRFKGLKQISPVGQNGEMIIDFCIFDAIKAGYGKIVFVIRKDVAETFKEKFHHKISDKIKVEYVFQELDMIPEGFSAKKREKPWGTGHAMLVAKNVVNEPFAVINADDFYGYQSFKTMADFLTDNTIENEYSMVGYVLNNTLSEHGSVSRGVCKTDNENNCRETNKQWINKICKSVDIHFATNKI